VELITTEEAVKASMMVAAASGKDFPILPYEL
jgi:hypothetical protein